MSAELVSIAQHALMLAAVFASFRLWLAIDRLFFRFSAIVLFCLGHYGWALLAFALLCIAESAHRSLMAERRAAGLYNGRWID